MAALFLTPIILSLVVLAAHFLRAGNLLFVAILLGLIALLQFPRRWVAWLIQIVLLLGVVEWIYTLLAIVEERRAQNRPYRASVIILSSVVVVTLLSSLAFFTRTLRQRYLRL